jgi:hypothetical protein
MRTLRYQVIIGLIFLTLFNSAQAELIYGFNNVSVTKKLTTLVEFDQADFKNFQKTDNLKLRVSDGDKIIREDAILNKDGVWVWNKILPFSENLKFLILKDDKPISAEYFSDTKSSLTLSASDSLPMIRGVLLGLPHLTQKINKIRFPIALPKKSKDCNDKILAIVFNKKDNILLWQYYGEIKDDLKTDEIDYSENLQGGIITDEGGCYH